MFNYSSKHKNKPKKTPKNSSEQTNPQNQPNKTTGKQTNKKPQANKKPLEEFQLLVLHSTGKAGQPWHRGWKLPGEVYVGRFKRKNPRTGRSVIKNGIQPLEDNEDFHIHLPGTSPWPGSL